MVLGTYKKPGSSTTLFDACVFFLLLLLLLNVVSCCSSKTASFILLVSTQVHLSQRFCLGWKICLLFSATLQSVWTHQREFHKTCCCPLYWSFILLTKEDILKIYKMFFFWGKSLEVNDSQQLFTYQLFSEYLLLCSTEERNSYRFGTYWRWVNDNICGWTLGESF